MGPGASGAPLALPDHRCPPGRSGSSPASPHSPRTSSPPSAPSRPPTFLRDRFTAVSCPSPSDRTAGPVLFRAPPPPRVRRTGRTWREKQLMHDGPALQARTFLGAIPSSSRLPAALVLTTLLLGIILRSLDQNRRGGGCCRSRSRRQCRSGSARAGAGAAEPAPGGIGGIVGGETKARG